MIPILLGARLQLLNDVEITPELSFDIISLPYADNLLTWKSMKFAHLIIILIGWFVCFYLDKDWYYQGFE